MLNPFAVKISFILIFFSLSCLVSAQNTIGGVKTTVPEAEVKRQSAFLNAERERLLLHYDKALEAYKAFLFENPEYDAAWYGIARTYAAQNDLTNALESIEKAIKIAPDNQWYLVYHADLFEKNGRNKDAMAAYENLTKKYPETPAFYEKLAYLAIINAEPKKGLKALDKLEEFQGINEQNIAKKHLIYIGLGDNKKAAEEFRKLANTYPNNLRYQHQLAEFFERIGDKASAKKVWEETAMKFPKDPVSQLAIAGKQSGSDAQYLESVKPLFSDAKVSIDTKVKELVPYLPKFDAGTDPEMVKKMLELGAILEKTHPEEAKAWSISGDMFYLKDRQDEALERYMHCIQLNPGVFSVWDNALDILMSQKNFADAQLVAEQAIDAFPNQPKGYMYLAAAALSMGHYDVAANNLEQALLMVGNNNALRAEILDMSGDAYLGKGDKVKAKEMWGKAYEIVKNPDIQAKISRLQ